MFFLFSIPFFRFNPDDVSVGCVYVLTLIYFVPVGTINFHALTHSTQPMVCARNLCNISICSSLIFCNESQFYSRNCWFETIDVQESIFIFAFVLFSLLYLEDKPIYKIAHTYTIHIRHVWAWFQITFDCADMSVNWCVFYWYIYTWIRQHLFHSDSGWKIWLRILEINMICNVNLITAQQKKNQQIVHDQLICAARFWGDFFSLLLCLQ